MVMTHAFVFTNLNKYRQRRAESAGTGSSQEGLDARVEGVWDDEPVGQETRAAPGPCFGAWGSTSTAGNVGVGQRTELAPPGCGHRLMGFDLGELLSLLATPRVCGAGRP